VSAQVSVYRGRQEGRNNEIPALQKYAWNQEAF